nr:alpha/beta hydrolase [Rodentibacter myodis]
MQNIPKKFGNRSIYAKQELAKRYDKLEDTYNGFKALAWLPNVEYYLNLAAAGKDELSDFDLWDKYSRIVGVTWSGSVDPDINFFRAEMYANESGRKLAGVLKQLIDENIRINIITHSLGARVALSAMNILGDFDGKYDDKIDNLIMWEAAVADNAITNLDNYEAKKAYNPVAMEIFPYAHKVPKHITVLYSQEDGVLDGDDSWRDDEFLGLLGGAYPKKYWAIGGAKWAFRDYYQGTEIEEFRESFHPISPPYSTDYGFRKTERKSVMSRAYYRQAIRKLLEQEAKQVAVQGGIAELNYLKPWSHFRRFPEEVLEHIIEVLTDNMLSNWNGKGSEVRGALGHCGNRRTTEGQDKWGNPVSEKEAKRWHDKFIADLPIEKLEFFGQFEIRRGENFYYFISHSAMREWEYQPIDIHQVFPLIYKYSYKREIMDKKIKLYSKFGRY